MTRQTRIWPPRTPGGPLAPPQDRPSAPDEATVPSTSASMASTIRCRLQPRSCSRATTRSNSGVRPASALMRQRVAGIGLHLAAGPGLAPAETEIRAPCLTQLLTRNLGHWFVHDHRRNGTPERFLSGLIYGRSLKCFCRDSGPLKCSQTAPRNSGPRIW
jgi:hypothetical protein